ncbi:fimbrial protein [Shewanella algae]|uniref:hypothetical protein n=1 Tax=Shewanella algae TaxID=38313 RepID=UPI00119C9F9D|nr:hypothetical protein [Shewanella algae]
MKSIKIATIAAAVSLLSVASVQAAPTGTVTFTGAVTAATCDTSITVGGVPTPSGQVNVGSVAPSATGTAVTFEIVSEASGGGVCTASGTADVFWSSASMSTVGIDNHTGSAVGSHVVLTSAPTSGTAVAITAANTQATFPNADVIGNGMPFTAQLVGGATAGNYYSTATYNVVYN